ncbi:MAG: ATP-grasp domain-containing protein [Treponema sp.]|nr:ATP-grasp domain-containing protein [Treponema sp.]
MNKYLLMLGGGLMQMPAIEAARKLNCHITLADGSENAFCKNLADVFAHVDLKDVDGLITLAHKMKNTTGIDGVFTAGTDFSASVAAVAQSLDLPGHSLEAALNASDKTRMRSCFALSDVPSPKFAKIDKNDLDSFYALSSERFLEKFGFSEKNFPLVVKPVDNMGGRGCKMVFSAQELIQALKEAINFSRTKTAILEEYMDGPEFSVDSIVYNGKIIITGFADRHIFYPPYFIEMGHTMPTAYGGEDIEKLIYTFKLGVKSLGLTCGAAKGDLKLTKNGPMIGEIAARLSGGYMSGWTYPYASGIDLTEQLLRIALGMKPTLDLFLDFVPCNAFSAERAWISIPGVVKEILGLSEAEKIENIKQVFVRSKVADKVVFPQNNVEKCGNVISQGKTRESACFASEEAVKKITILLEKNNTETENFLTQPLSTDYPCSAYYDSSDDFAKIVKEIEKMSGKLCFSDGLPSGFNDGLPKFLKSYKHLKDWNGKTLEFAFEQFCKIILNYNCVKNNTKKEIAEKDFWKAFLRGGIQGGLYIV